MSEATPVDQPGSAGPAGSELDRLDALEDQLGELAARLAGWVEAQLVGAVDDRRAELGALRAEVLESVDARLAGVAEVVAGAGDAGEAVTRIEAFEGRVKAAMGRLSDSFETRLAEAAAARATELDALRGALGDRLDRLEREAEAASEGVAGLGLSSRAATERTDAAEQAAKAAVARLERSVEARLGALAAQVKAASDGVAALKDEAGAGPARAEQLEQRVRSAMGRLAESVEAQLAEAVAARPEEAPGARTGREQRRRADTEALRRELEDALARQVREARTEIGTAVADAHRRFVVAVDELDERVAEVSRQSAAAQAVVAGVEALPDAVASDGRRIEALEEHTRRTDDRLRELVEAKLAELAAERLAEIAGARDQLRQSVDAHLADIRAEVAFTLAEGRTEVAAATTRIDSALAAIGALGASAEGFRDEGERRLAHTFEARVGELDSAAGEVRRQVEELAAQVAGLVSIATTEGGILAPLRSDIRLLQAQLAELAETVEGIRPKRRAAPPAKKAARRVLPPAPAKKPATAAAKVTAPARKAPGTRRRVQ